MKNRRGTLKIDLVNLALLIIIGSLAGTLLFRAFTPLPTWACFLLGLPIGTATSACLFGGATYFVVRIIKKYSRWQR